MLQTLHLGECLHEGVDDLASRDASFTLMKPVT